MRRQLSMIRQAISPRLAIRILLNMACLSIARPVRGFSTPSSYTTIPEDIYGQKIAWSHPEHAKAGGRNGGVEAGAQRQRQHLAGLARVHHPVVPEPGRGVKRVGLAL